MIKLHLHGLINDPNMPTTDAERWCQDDDCAEAHVLQMSDYEFQEAITNAYERGLRNGRIRVGIDEARAGRTRPWDEVRAELGL